MACLKLLLNEKLGLSAISYSRSRKGIFTGQIGKVWSQKCMKQVTLNNILHVKLNCNKQCYEHVSDTVVAKFFRVNDRKTELYLGWFVE